MILFLINKARLICWWIGIGIPPVRVVPGRWTIPGRWWWRSQSTGLPLWPSSPSPSPIRVPLHTHALLPPPEQDEWMWWKQSSRWRKKRIRLMIRIKEEEEDKRLDARSKIFPTLWTSAWNENTLHSLSSFLSIIKIYRLRMFWTSIYSASDNELSKQLTSCLPEFPLTSTSPLLPVTN